MKHIHLAEFSWIHPPQPPEEIFVFNWHDMVLNPEKRYGQNPAIIGWQMDNVIGHYENGGCCCVSCHQGFSDFLKKIQEDAPQNALARVNADTLICIEQ